MSMNDKLPEFDTPLGVIPNLHPAFLLRDLQFTWTPPPLPLQKATVDCILRNPEAGVEFILSKEGYLQIQISNPDRIFELRDILQRALGSWSPQKANWAWQLDAMLSPHMRDIARQEKERINGRP
jgi:hypothetical protein